MKYIYLLIFLQFNFCFCQVVAEGDTTLCESASGEVTLTLTAESFNVDLTDSGIYSDDTYGGVIDIGFDFVFYGNTYNQVVLSSNNHLTFNIANANNYSDWTITDPAPNNFDCPLNSILCPWQDIYPGVNGNGTIQYATTGEAPNRVFIASFCGIPMFSCTDICYTSQIKLFEGTNIIETHIAQKVLCTTWNDGAAIHGLHNSTGTIANIVTGLDGIERNYPNQWTCENDGWSFTPNGPNDYTIQNITFAPAVAGDDIIWQDNNGNIIGYGSSIDVTPVSQNGETVVYTAGASLCGSAGDWCGFEGGIEGDEVFINFEPTEITTNYQNPTCFQSGDGLINVALPANGNWEYQVTDEQNNLIDFGSIQNDNNFSVNNLNGGEFNIYVENEFGCTDNQLVSLTEPEQIVDDFTTINSSCFNENNGSLNLVLNGGTNPFTVFVGEINSGLIVEEQTNLNQGSMVTFNNLGPGEYYFTGIDQNGCLTEGDEIFFDISEPEEIIIQATSEDVTCADANDGSVNISVNGGTGNYTFSWFGDNGFLSNQEDIANLAGGTYTLTVSDENDCSSSQIIEISEDAGISIDFSTSNYNGYEISCDDGNDGFIDLNINGGSSPYSISWDGPNGFTSNLEDISNLSSGLYTMYLSDLNGCEAFINLTLSEPQELELIIEETPEICGTGGSTFVQTFGGTSPISYNWIGPESFSSNQVDLINVSSGSYELTINDANNCMISDNIIIEYIDGPTCDFTASSYEFMLSNEPVNFYDNSSTDPNFNFQIESWIWEFGDGTISNEQNPSHLYSNPGLYYVWLTVTDENNCEQSVMKTINVLEEYYSYSPNAFSPNGDGVNDLFAPILTDIDYETYEINIFNRWGDIVFKTNNYDESWDGTFKGEDLPQAVYTYKITYKTRRGIDKQERGDIVLVK
tara:strand:+ start:21328 stop:24078 length:2751 start_codon:yes stop_codon:yes gene_type:complete